MKGKALHIISTFNSNIYYVVEFKNALIDLITALASLGRLNKSSFYKLTDLRVRFSTNNEQFADIASCNKYWVPEFRVLFFFTYVFVSNNQIFL